MGDASTLVTLARSLKLVVIVEELVTTNRALRAVWQGRRTQILTLIRDIVATPSVGFPMAVLTFGIKSLSQHLRLGPCLCPFAANLACQSSKTFLNRVEQGYSGNRNAIRCMCQTIP